LKTPWIVPHGQLLFRLAGPWSGIRPRLAVTLLNDVILQAECGVNLRDVCDIQVVRRLDIKFGYIIWKQDIVYTSCTKQ
jgi:hypothetical protein